MAALPRIGTYNISPLENPKLKDGCVICFEEFKLDSGGNPPVQHGGSNGPLHPVHLKCIEDWGMHSDAAGVALECPTCKAKVNRRALDALHEQVTGRPHERVARRPSLFGRLLKGACVALAISAVVFSGQSSQPFSKEPVLSGQPSQPFSQELETATSGGMSSQQMWAVVRYAESQHDYQAKDFWYRQAQIAERNERSKELPKKSPGTDKSSSGIHYIKAARPA